MANGLYNQNKFPGYFFNGDFKTLVDVVRQLPNKGTIVEIGTFLGRSTKFWADTSKLLNKEFDIICLDTYNNKGSDVFNENLNARIGGTLNSVNKFVHNKLTNLEMLEENFKQYKNIKFIKYDIFKNTPESLRLNDVVCVFDDAVHTSQGVTKTFNDWFPILEYNGIYCGHDYSQNYPEVISTINSITSTNNLNLVKPKQNSSMYYFTKVKHGQ